MRMRTEAFSESANSPVRVAQVIGKLNAAGVESVMNNYYRNMDREKFQFDFVIDSDGYCQPKQDLIALGARFYTVPPYQQLFAHIRALRRLFRQNGYQIVHAGMNSLSVFSLFAAWSVGVPIRISHSHNTASKGETGRNILKNLLRPFSRCFATHLCACSPEAGIWLFGKKAYRDGRVTIFKNAIDPMHFSFHADIRSAIREQYSLRDQLVVGHVGRYCYQKNQHFVLDAFAKLLQKEPDARLMLIGLGTDSGELRSAAAQLGIEKEVIFLGAQDDVSDYYQAMDVFLFPSHYEGLGLAAVEAQCAGLPVIASTAVPPEAKVTENIRFLPLDDGAEAWADAVRQAAGTSGSRFCGIDPAYDIRNEAKKLQDYYDHALRDLEHGK